MSLAGAPQRSAALIERELRALLGEDAVLPGSVLLGYARGDHWAVAEPFSRVRGPFGWLPRHLADRNAYPRELLLEAIVRAVEESL